MGFNSGFKGLKYPILSLVIYNENKPWTITHIDGEKNKKKIRLQLSKFYLTILL